VRRVRIGGLAGCAALLALVAAVSAPAPRPLELTAPSTTARLGFVGSRWGTSLVRLDPVSLGRVGRPLDLKGFAGAWAFSPDQRLLAVGVRQRSESSFETLRFYTVARPRRTGHGVALGGTAAALSWSRPDRILAYVNECCANPDGGATVLVIDPVTRRVVSRTSVDGSVLQVARSRDALVLLVGATKRIGPSRLEIFDADGGHRSARLDELAAGYTWPADSSGDPIMTRLVPGLAIDANGNRAFAVSAAGLVAEVDLGSLTVSYHRWAEERSALDRFATWFTPAAQAKGANGPVLTARWLEGGFLAVAGSDETATTVDGTLRISSHPLGLRIVDVHDWSASMLDSGAGSFAVADGLLLAAGASWSSEPQSESGMGLAAYGSDRVRRFQLLDGRPVWIGFVYRGRAYVSASGQTALEVVDLASGSTVGTRRGTAPWPLLDDSVRLFD
jgi:hypothetical protein